MANTEFWAINSDTLVSLTITDQGTGDPVLLASVVGDLVNCYGEVIVAGVGGLEIGDGVYHLVVPEDADFTGGERYTLKVTVTKGDLSAEVLVERAAERYRV